MNRPLPPSTRTMHRSQPMAWAAMAVLITLAAPPAYAEKAEKPNPEKEPPELVGFEMGRFVIKDFRPIQGEKVRLTFTLHAATRVENKKVFMRRLASREMRVRDQVITAMRIADPLEFDDPDLRLIRRRLHLRLGRAMPELAIEDIYFSDFRYLVD